MALIEVKNVIKTFENIAFINIYIVKREEYFFEILENNINY